MNKLLDDGKKRCPLPDFYRDTDNDLKVKHNHMNGQAFSIFERQDESGVEANVILPTLLISNEDFQKRLNETDVSGGKIKKTKDHL